ncbi:MAG: LUD domain-containing protein [Phycisphaerae bacterium]|nr:LUD domain-containing protein [Phycisphaerae bacterium]
MAGRILASIRDALRSGPVAAEVQPQATKLDGRLVPADADRNRLVATFAQRAETSAATVHVLDDAAKLPETLSRIIPANARITLCHSEKIDPRLGRSIVSVLEPVGRVFLAADLDDEGLFRSTVTVGPVDFAVAETGSIALAADPQRQRLASLVPNIHVAVLWADQIVPDLMDLDACFRKAYGQTLPGAVTLITGPSKTADIEMNLVVGVHGPAQLHLVVLP